MPLLKSYRNKPQDGSTNRLKANYSQQEQQPKHLHKAEFFSIQASIDTNSIRRETYNGTEHLVVPLVMLVEGVLWPSNAEGPELALAEEFGRFPAGWNGRPVVLGHPMIEGTPVSANSPSVLEEYAFGFLFNTRLKDTKLLSEAWINLDRANDLGGNFKDTVDRLEASTELTEVSTGLFSMNEDASGDYDGEEYIAIWRNIVPDHLAILPQGVKGACSVEDGCGAPRVSGAASFPGSSGSGTFYAHKQNSENSENSQNSTEGVMSKDKTQCSCNDNGDQTMVSASAGVTKLNDGPGAETPPDPETQEGIFKSLISRFGDMLSFRSNQNELSDRDTRTALEVALTELSDSYFYIIAVFDDFFVYEEGFDFALLRRGYSISEDGVVTLMNDPVKVRPVTTFIPLETSTPGNEPTTSTNAEEATMDKTAKIEALISNESTPFEESDKEYLTSLEDGKLSALSDKFIPSEGEGEGTTTQTTETQVPAANAQSQSEPKPAQSAQPVQPATVDEYINSAPPEMREVLKASHSLHQQKRQELVDVITNNSRNKFSAEQLKGMEMSTLENLAAIADSTGDYSGAGAGNLRYQASQESTDEAVPTPPKLFAVNNDGQAS